MDKLSPDDLEFLRWLDKQGERYWECDGSGEKFLPKASWEKALSEFNRAKGEKSEKDLKESQITHSIE